jgi:hypothetical protein
VTGSEQTAAQTQSPEERSKALVREEIDRLLAQSDPRRLRPVQAEPGPEASRRRSEVLITALDSDEIRHAAQRELPRVLIDGSTGRDLNMRIERVQLGKWGCLGCTSQAPAPTVERDDGCGTFADPRAPSVSFLAALPGILAAAELIKETMGDGDAGLRGERIETEGFCPGDGSHSWLGLAWRCARRESNPRPSA